MPCLVCGVDCTHVRSTTASFKDLVIVAQEDAPTKPHFGRGTAASAAFGLITISLE